MTKLFPGGFHPCLRHSALSPASLHPTQKTVLPQKRGIFPGRHFQGASTSNSLLEADRLGRLESVSLAPFRLLVGDPTPLLVSFPLASLSCWLGSLRQDLTKAIYILMTGPGRAEPTCGGGNPII